MSKFHSLAISLMFVLATFASATVSHAGDGDFSDPYSYSSQFPDAASVGGHNRVEAQRRAEADAAYQRSQQQKLERDTPPAATPHHYGTDTVNIFNSTTGIFSSCFGSGGSRTCVDTAGGKK